jgi:hypothetical protein
LSTSSDANGNPSYKNSIMTMCRVEQRKIPKNLFATNAVDIYVI